MSRQQLLGEVNDLLAPDDPRQWTITSGGHKWTLSPGPLEQLWIAMCSAKMETFSIPCSKGAQLRLAQPDRLFEHRIEHWRQIAWRGIDHLQYLGSRSLLL